jgi:hypothetical protein
MASGYPWWERSVSLKFEVEVEREAVERINVTSHDPEDEMVGLPHKFR